MGFLISSALNATGRAAGRAALPAGLVLLIALFATITYAAVLAGGFILLAANYGHAIAWFILAAINAVFAILALVILMVIVRRREKQVRSAEMAALALAIAPRLLSKSPIGSLIAIGALTYVLAKARSD